MKCISKIFVCILGIAMTGSLLSGCASAPVVSENAYDVYETSNAYGLSKADVTDVCKLFSDDICVVGFDDSFSQDGLGADAAESAGVFKPDSRQTEYAQNVHEKRYPASTTKIMTAYLALKYGNLDDIVTVSAKAGGFDSESSLCYIHEGDQLTLEQLLYGLMLASGNDAATAIAEHISGSEEAFADLMNEEAKKLGATKTHFVNPHGLPDDDHYTTLYDLYLIFNKAIQYETFVDIIQTKEYTAEYKDQSGEAVVRTWENSNWYLNGDAAQPDQITVIGGKTGTTNSAGCCLVLLSKNSSDEPIISIVLKAGTKADLYGYMSRLLANFSN